VDVTEPQVGEHLDEGQVGLPGADRLVQPHPALHEQPHDQSDQRQTEEQETVEVPALAQRGLAPRRDVGLGRRLSGPVAGGLVADIGAR
jgi:hypothetical protein